MSTTVYSLRVHHCFQQQIISSKKRGKNPFKIPIQRNAIPASVVRINSWMMAWRKLKLGWREDEIMCEWGVNIGWSWSRGLGGEQSVKAGPLGIEASITQTLKSWDWTTVSQDRWAHLIRVSDRWFELKAPRLSQFSHTFPSRCCVAPWGLAITTVFRVGKKKKATWVGAEARQESRASYRIC